MIVFQTLISLYNKVLSAVGELPEEAGYRRHTEELTKNRLQIVESVGNYSIAFIARSFRSLIFTCRND